MLRYKKIMQTFRFVSYLLNLNGWYAWFLRKSASVRERLRGGLEY